MFLRCLVLTDVLTVVKFMTLNAVSLGYELDKLNFVLSFLWATAYKLDKFYKFCNVDFAAILGKMKR